MNIQVDVVHMHVRVLVSLIVFACGRSVSKRLFVREWLLMDFGKSSLVDFNYASAIIAEQDYNRKLIRNDFQNKFI